MAGPFDGVRVLDMTTVVVGPYSTQMLGDMGAEVIKVEAPDGDLTRGGGPSVNPGMGANYLQINRNKRAIALNLKTEGGAEALRTLLRETDVFVHNMRPEPLARLGFDYDSVRDLKPDMVYCNIWGFGRGGRYAGQAAYDDVIQGASGLVALEGFGGQKARYVPSLIADKTTGLFAAYAMAAALYHRLATGEGQEIEVPMFESMVSFTFLEHLCGESFVPAQGRAGSLRHATPLRWPYATKDGHICAMPGSDKHWRGFLTAIDREDLWDNPIIKTRDARRDNMEQVIALLGELMATRTTAEWVDVLSKAGVPCMPISTLDDVVADGHLADVGFWRETDHESEGRVRLMNPPYTLTKSPATIRCDPPRFGEHTRTILAEHGYDADAVERLVAEGAAIDEKTVKT
jgi:crotonobetainyl-CoA:carnitine CoA-transferase CaiB-like acyl-CoA transferase